MNDAANEAYRFLADAMLGRLARWLRMLGYDTWYDAAADDHSLVMRADYERRIVLTRDRHDRASASGARAAHRIGRSAVATARW